MSTGRLSPETGVFVSHYKNVVEKLVSDDRHNTSVFDALLPKPLAHAYPYAARPRQHDHTHSKRLSPGKKRRHTNSRHLSARRRDSRRGSRKHQHRSPHRSRRSAWEDPLAADESRLDRLRAQPTVLAYPDQAHRASGSHGAHRRRRHAGTRAKDSPIFADTASLSSSGSLDDTVRGTADTPRMLSLSKPHTMAFSSAGTDHPHSGHGGVDMDAGVVPRRYDSDDNKERSPAQGGGTGKAFDRVTSSTPATRSGFGVSALKSPQEIRLEQQLTQKDISVLELRTELLALSEKYEELKERAYSDRAKAVDAKRNIAHLKNVERRLNHRILELEQLLKRSHTQYDQQVSTVQKQLDEQVLAMMGLERHDSLVLQQKEVELASLRRKLADQAVQMQAAQSTIDAKEDEMRAVQTRLRQQQNELLLATESTQQKIHQVHSSADRVRTDNQQLRVALADSEEKLVLLRKQLAQRDERVKRLEREQAESSRADAETTRTLDSLRSQVASLTTRLEDSMSLQRSSAAQLASTQATVVKLEADKHRLSEELKVLRDSKAGHQRPPVTAASHAQPHHRIVDEKHTDDDLARPPSPDWLRGHTALPTGRKRMLSTTVIAGVDGTGRRLSRMSVLQTTGGSASPHGFLPVVDVIDEEDGDANGHLEVVITEEHVAMLQTVEAQLSCLSTMVKDHNSGHGIDIERLLNKDEPSDESDPGQLLHKIHDSAQFLRGQAQDFYAKAIGDQCIAQ